ncbi:hypothetical protein VNI00_019054 [Paramarasmius palmivorus]|uniref:Uncharacterized protein n=1 Tax=Paramarasmius palmivorus TaxID=297713 RepID=A0AAW0AS68_9AGAR
MSDQPPSHGPKLFHRLKKSISGQNLAKSNKEAQKEHHEDTVPEEAVTVPMEPSDEPVVAADKAEESLEPVANSEFQGEVAEVQTVKEEAKEEAKEAQEAGKEDTAAVEVTGATTDDSVVVHHDDAHVDVDDHKEHKVTGLQRLKSLAKFNKDKRHRAATPTSDHPAEAGDAVAVEDLDAQRADGGTENGEHGATGGDGNHDTSPSNPGDDEDNDPATLADRIRTLIQSLPPPTKPVAVPSKPKIPQLDTNGRPIPPQDAVHVDDSKLAAILRNPSIMNGNACRSGADGEDKDKPSVWAVLDSFQAPTTQAPNEGEGKDGSTTPGDGDDDGDSDTESDDGSEVGEPLHIILDDSSVMIYAPLIPSKDSKVEIAESQIVPITSSTNGAKLAASVKQHLGEAESKIVEMLSPGQYRMYGTYGRRATPPVIGGGDEAEPSKETQVIQAKFSWKFWPWKKKTATPTPAPTTPGTNAPAPAPGGGSGDGKDKSSAPADEDKKKHKPRKLRKPKPVLDQRIWVPSRTNLSIQALWWGYRIFLPPPVLAVLSDKTIEATKRAAMVTTALTWLFSNLPLKMFPVPMQPAILMLQQLVPYLGYVGTFITWSWGTIKSYDVGYGVILSATWILPVALIPGTWQAYDFPADGGNNGSTTPAPGQGQPSTGTPSQPSTGAPSTGTPSTGTPSQPSTGAPSTGTPSTGTPSQPSTGAPSTGTPSQPSTGTPTQPSTGAPTTPADPTTPAPDGKTPTPSPIPPSTGTEPIHVSIDPIPPTVSTRLRMVKGVKVPESTPLPQSPDADDVATRLAQVKGDPNAEPAAGGEEQKSGYGFWKYITG